jgi:acyl CoA:acetate/3-ketoacid CoA transferase beta subunit
MKVRGKRVLIAFITDPPVIGKIPSTLPLTGQQVVHRLITDLCVMDVEQGELIVRELAPEVTFEEVCRRSQTKKVRLAPEVTTFRGA